MLMCTLKSLSKCEYNPSWNRHKNSTIEAGAFNHINMDCHSVTSSLIWCVSQTAVSAVLGTWEKLCRSKEISIYLHCRVQEGGDIESSCHNTEQWLATTFLIIIVIFVARSGKLQWWMENGNNTKNNITSEIVNICSFNSLSFLKYSNWFITKIIRKFMRNANHENFPNIP